MSRSFLGAVYHGEARLLLEHLEARDLAPGEIRLRPMAAGICGTDVHILHGDFRARPPVVLGHEFAGEVLEVGAEVHQVRVGDRVAIEPHRVCRRCTYCTDGREHLCVARQGFGVHLHGGFATEVVVSAVNAYAIPSGLAYDVAALAEPLGCCLHGIERAAIRQGDDVLVLGAGPIGLMLVRLASRAGAARIVVVEPNERRRALADGYGATHVADVGEAAELIADLTQGRGVDVALEASGSVVALQQAFELLGAGGRLVIFGVSSPAARISISPHRVFAQELTIVGSLINPYAHRRALALLPSLDLGGLITHTFPLGDIHQAIETAASGEALKVQILAPTAPHA
jgi:L-iditol 2-dehydrogenase